MKKTLMVIMGVILLASCSKNTQYTQDLTGSWYIYKLTYKNFEVPNTLADSLGGDTITFTAAGQYTERYQVLNLSTSTWDTIHHIGTWQFQDSYGKLVLTDTSRVQTVYTIFNLQGNHMELLRNSYDRYMRKVQ